MMIKMFKSRRIRWMGHVAQIGKMRNAYKVLVEKPEEEGPLARSGRRWKDNIKMKDNNPTRSRPHYAINES
jgi:hypothetical protein